MLSREVPRFPDQERTPEWPRMRAGKWLRTRTQLGPASSSTRRGQYSSSGHMPTATAAPINHVQLQCPKHELFFVQCQDSGHQFLVNGSSTVTANLTAARRLSCQRHSDQHQRQHHPHLRLHNKGIELGRPTVFAQLHLCQSETDNSRPGFVDW